ncbi:MAG TPA: beta-L-arabinofuranosidase domain-containing protein [Armatimonadota bacterium]|nr:beta-L-arabinofuranosidase domain-containing protein [Armatimonadota bacterium]
MVRSKASLVNWRDAGVVSTSGSPYCKLRPVPIRAVQMLPGFWKPRMDANRQQSIPALLQLLEEHGVVDNFRRLSGRKEVERRGPYFTDSDLYKWIEAAAFVLQSEDDPKIARMLDEVIDDVVAAQCEDGYLNTFFTGELADQRFRNLPGEHELYCAGHLFQAAIAHHRATGSRKLLDAATRFADYLTTIFGPGKIETPDGHPEIEMALVELYRTTGTRGYLDLAGFFLSLQKFADKQAMEGHAVRAAYLASGGADYYAESGHRTIIDAVERLWADTAEGKMYITGGLGSRYDREAFGWPYELPNERAYAETCAGIANIFWNWRMLAIEGESRFADVMERTLYNGFLSGVSLDGTHYFYMNPLACFCELRRQPWYDTTCCPPNVERMIASLPGCFYSTSDEGIWAHLYDNSRLNWHLEDGRKVSLEQKTSYPWDGSVEIAVSPEAPTEFALFLRIPGWCENASVSIGGEAQRGVPPGEYLKLERTWKPGDVVHLELPMPVSLQESDPRVRENTASIAIQRGPVIYCVESPDNPGVPIRDVELLIGDEFCAEFKPGLLGGVTVVRAKGLHPAPGQNRGLLYREFGSVKLEMEQTALTAIPYYAWANRGPSEMTVWIPGR